MKKLFFFLVMFLLSSQQLLAMDRAEDAGSTDSPLSVRVKKHVSESVPIPTPPITIQEKRRKSESPKSSPQKCNSRSPKKDKGDSGKKKVSKSPPTTNDTLIHSDPPLAAAKPRVKKSGSSRQKRKSQPPQELHKDACGSDRGRCRQKEVIERGDTLFFDHPKSKYLCYEGIKMLMPDKEATMGGSDSASASNRSSPRPVEEN